MGYQEAMESFIQVENSLKKFDNISDIAGFQPEERQHKSVDVVGFHYLLFTILNSVPILKLISPTWNIVLLEL